MKTYCALSNILKYVIFKALAWERTMLTRSTKSASFVRLKYTVCSIYCDHVCVLFAFRVQQFKKSIRYSEIEM